MKSILLNDVKSAVRASSEVLKEGGVIVYPTDTVYGFGADATNEKAVSKLRMIKNRESTKLILVMVSDKEMLERYAVLTPLAEKIMKNFLPGPLTMILKTKEGVDDLKEIQSENKTVGFRIPDNKFCLELVKTFGRPITSTSVNISGMNQARNLSCMLSQLGGRSSDVDLVVDAGKIDRSEPSTIVDISGTDLKIVRKGALSEELIRSVL